MKMAHPPTSPASNRSLVAAYEDLRRKAARAEAPRGAGYALLVRRGLAAWMSTWSAYVGAREENNLSAASDSSAVEDALPIAPLPTMMQTEIVTVLASMALGHPRAEVRL